MDRNEIEEGFDKIYAVGFKNGQMEMRNKVLMKINRDWSLITIRKPMDLIIKILKIVNKIPITKHSRASLTTK